MQPITEPSERHQRLLENFHAGERTALARAISIVEDGRAGFEALLGVLHADLGTAHRIGITGPPGAGKSTLTAALIRLFRERDETVGVVAVDPSSPFTGGALLGDRIRMNEVATDPGVFVRSMATRGAVGGLALTTKEAADVMDAYGFDRLVLETVGVGQSELDIASAADSTAVVLMPESGDMIQAMKAGLMEISDLFIVNKADRPGAVRMKREIEMTLRMRRGEARRGPTPGQEETSDEWRIPVLETTAESGEGVVELVETLDTHREWLVESGELSSRRRARLAERVREATERDLARLAREQGEALLEDALPALERGETTPYEVAARIVRAATG